MYERLVYVSRAAPGIGPRDCYDIIRVAHNRNSTHQLTGGLVFVDGCFVQVLEGNAWSLRRRFAVIAADPRHRDVTVRQQIASPELLFADDWMALRGDADISDELKAAWSYHPAWPMAERDGQRLADFVQACCRAQRPARAEVQAQAEAQAG